MKNISNFSTEMLDMLAAFWAFSLAFVILADVIGRSFGHPIQGTTEIVANYIVAIVFLQFPLAIRSGGFLRANLFLDIAPMPLRTGIDILGYLLGAFVFGAMLLGQWSDMITGFRIREFEGEGALRVPVYPVRAVICVMSMICILVYLGLILRSLTGRRSPDPVDFARKS